MQGHGDPLFAPAALFTALQLACVLLHHDGCLPLSCVPMFQLPRRLNDALPKTAVITAVPNNHGSLPRTPEPYYWVSTGSGFGLRCYLLADMGDHYNGLHNYGRILLRP